MLSLGPKIVPTDFYNPLLLRQTPYTPHVIVRSEEMRALATASTPVLQDEMKCLPITSELMVDTTWRDDFGHDCIWVSFCPMINAN